MNKLCIIDTHPKVAEMWDYEKNNKINLDIKTITHACRKSAWFKCQKDQTHNFFIRVKNVVRTLYGTYGRKKSESCCPYCSGKIFHPSKSLEALYPELIKQLLKPEEGKYISSNSSKILEWICSECKQIYKTSPDAKTKCKTSMCRKCSTTKNSEKNRENLVKLLIEHTNKKHELSKIQFFEDVKDIHGDKYDYSKTKYIFSGVKCEIFCKKCQLFFKQSPSSHLRGHGCPNCCKLGSTSKKEAEWLDYLNIPNIPVKNRQTPIYVDGKMFYVDGFIPETNTIYEFNGCLFHGCNICKQFSNRNELIFNSTFEERYQKTIERERILKENGYNIISIWEHEWNELKSKISNAPTN